MLTPNTQDEEFDEQEYEPPARQLMENPQSGEWELLTVDEWIRLRANLPKDDEKTPLCEVHWRAGIKCATAFALGTCNFCELTYEWIKSQLKVWKIVNGAEFVPWIQFIASVYDMETLAQKYIQPYVDLKMVASQLAAKKAEKEEKRRIKFMKIKNKLEELRGGNRRRNRR